MTKILTFFVTIGIIFSSCQKEFSESNDGQQPTDSMPPAGRLAKRLMISGTNYSDTTTTEYSYILQNLESEKTTMKVRLANGSYDIKYFYTRYYRDPVRGLILKIARTGPYSDNGNNPDSIFDYITYKPSPSNEVVSINNGSRIYEYKEDRVFKTSDYMPWPNPGDPLKLVVYHLYYYDTKGNIIRREEFTDQDNNGVFELNITYRFEYDDKRNPLRSAGDDALLEWRWALMSPNNVIKQINDVANPGGTDDEIITIYEYGEDNQPRSGGYNLGLNPILLKFIYE